MVIERDITIVRQLEIPEAVIKLRSDGIVHVFYKENVTLDIKLQTSMRELYRDLTGGKKANFIFESDEGFTVTTEARNNSTRLEVNSPINASALIIKNLASRIIANFFIKVNKPKIKYKLFSNVKEAVDWLHAHDLS